MTEHPWVARARRAGDRLTVFAHRGGAGLAPENTRGAFRQAAALGVDGCELDVRLSKDGEVVVIHDATLDRTTDADGPVSALTAAELGRVDAGFRFGADAGFPWRGRGEGVPRLADVLADHPALPFIVEVKGDDPAVAQSGGRGRGARRRPRSRVLRRLRGRDAGGGARRAAHRVHQRRDRGDPPRALQVLRLVAARPRRRISAFQVPEVANGGTRIVSPRFVRLARRGGRVLHVWTVNTPDDIAPAEGVGRRRRDHRPPRRRLAVSLTCSQRARSLLRA